jgi:hypothetical protein
MYIYNSQYSEFQASIKSFPILLNELYALINIDIFKKRRFE